MPAEHFSIRLTERQSRALRDLASLEDLPPEVYAAEVLTKHLYHAYTPAIRERSNHSRTEEDHDKRR